MSCDESEAKAAAARDERKRSLPIFGGAAQAAAAVEPPRYWRSLTERARALPASAANEFPAGASELDARLAPRLHAAAGRLDAPSPAWAPPARSRTRRSSRSSAAPTRSRRATRCTSRPATRWKATRPACWSRATRDARPRSRATPSHPDTLGATTAFEQALILGLYDDDRAQQLRRGDKQIAWTTFLAELRTRCDALAGERRRGAALPDRADRVAAAGRSAPPHPGAVPQGQVRQLRLGVGRRRRRRDQAGLRPAAGAAPPI